MFCRVNFATKILPLKFYRLDHDRAAGWLKLQITNLGLKFSKFYIIFYSPIIFGLVSFTDLHSRDITTGVNYKWSKMYVFKKFGTVRCLLVEIHNNCYSGNQTTYRLSQKIVISYQKLLGTI